MVSPLHRRFRCIVRAAAARDRRDATAAAGGRDAYEAMILRYP
jgi:hypothetical protein